MGDRVSEDIRPFHIDVPEAVLTDLRERLGNARWPDPEVVDDWSQGAPLAYVRTLAEYWRDGYDWRAREAHLNSFDQYRTAIDGLDLHFVHVRSEQPDALPLLITHGWPGSFAEFQRVYRPLAAAGFHVVAPSLPGFGFSAKPTGPGIGVARVAELWAALMARLGYSRYVAQGGDWGSAVTALVGGIDPEHCAGIHVTLAMGTGPAGEPTEPDELRAIERIQHYLAVDSGYSTQQKSRPQTLGYGLHDSPVGQLAWILEKFWAWTDHRHVPDDPLAVLGRDEVLDDITLYWVTGTATSSARLYWESFGKRDRVPVAVPTGVAVYPAEIVPPVRKWMEPTFTNITHWREYERGGHFAAWEVPDTFVADLVEWAAPLR
ncbi:MAG TPA: epoxide hydrolase [Ilumatobacter sp.]|nr:epoxide hydrolase [Ilumatobacter sp.]